jgi:hypothetical protein
LVDPARPIKTLANCVSENNSISSKFKIVSL